MDIASIMAIIQLVTLLLPLVQQVVQWIEDSVNQAKTSGTITTVTGADKKAAALTFIQQLWPTIAQTGTGAKVTAALTPDQIVSTTSNLIDGVVGIYNTLGIFKKSTPAVTPTA
jgi:hypothetical protein